ncbi:hypothetical protein ABH932_004403 [Streptacidiphilus sp. MAP5-52]
MPGERARLARILFHGLIGELTELEGGAIDSSDE